MREEADHLSETASGAPHRAWALGVLFVAGALNLFDRQIVNILAQSIKVEFKLSDAQLGLVTGTAFAVVYALLGIPLGRLADRVNRVRLMATLLIIWSSFTAMCGVSSSFLQLLIARTGVGIGEAGAQPGSAALVSDLFPADRRASAMSILLASVPVGGFLGLVVGGYVGTVWGWRTAFVVAGLPGILVALVMLTTMRDPGRRGGAATAETAFFPVFRALLRNRRFIFLAIAWICASFVPYACGAWLPAYFIRAYGMTASTFGMVAAIALGVGGTLGTLCSGLIADALRPRVAFPELSVVIASLGLSLLALLVTIASTERTLAFIGLFALNVFSYAFLGPSISIIQEEVGPHARALGVAICASGAGIVGLGVGVYVVGKVSDVLAAHFGKLAIGNSLALVVVAVGVVGMFAYWGAHRAERGALPGAV
jgi:MFS transporter, Spinster family, sphingosine-1-phosphate transporter